jgi:uncharacterized membrane protein
VVAKGNEKVRIFVTPESLKATDDLRLGFLEASNPRKFNAMLQLATLNAARTMVKPVKAKAPVRTGRLRGAVAARKGKNDRPSSVVGVKAGKSRGDMQGAWYRWFVVSGTSGTRNTKRQGRVNIQRVPARDFVKQAVTEPSVQARAIEVLNNTIQAFLDGTIKYRGRRGRR